MKKLLISMNSKYIHSSLGAWYLKTAAQAEDLYVEVMQCTINDSLDRVLANIYERRPEILAFSCYIWNIGEVLWLCENIKKLLPEVTLILGGPEVSFDSSEALKSNPYVDYIIKGEGEETFPKLLKAIENKLSLASIDSLCYRSEGEFKESAIFGIVQDLDKLPSPYTDEMLSFNKGRIMYYEASRGCPYSCAYCLSSTFDGVRYFSMSRVKTELKKIIESGFKQVKFVDRTFNANRKRAKEILEFISSEFGHLDDINFHFEVAADLFDEDLIELVNKLPEGLVQFEAGVQSTNEEVLVSVKRKTDTKMVLHNLEKLVKSGKVHLHSDLIAGLPKEDIKSFAKSFEELYSKRPHQLQLGFLKLLRGSGIRNEYRKYEYVYKSNPPYEVLSNMYLSYDDILELKRVEELVERLYNSNRFKKSLEYLIKSYNKGAYGFYKDFGQWFEENGLFDRGISPRELYKILMEYGENISGADNELLNQLLIFDYLSADNTGNIPRTLDFKIDKQFIDRCFEFLKNQENINMFLPHLKQKSAKEIYKNVYFFDFSYSVISSETFNNKGTVVLFDYTCKDRVSGLYPSIMIDL